MDIKLKMRKAGILLAYPVAYLYIRLVFQHIPLTGDSVEWWVALSNLIFVLVFIAWNEVVRKGLKDGTAKNSYFWYTVMVLAAATTSISPSPLLSIFATHLCAVYSVAVSNDILYEGKTGRFIVYDLMSTGLSKTFPHFWKIVRDAGEIRETEKTSEPDNKPKGRIGASVLMILAIFPVFIIVVSLLSVLNTDFSNGVAAVLEKIRFVRFFDLFLRIIGRMIFAVPVCFFLYAMLSSCAVSDGAKEKEKCQKHRERSLKKRLVPFPVTGTIIAVFDIIYLLFFILEAKYLFGGLLGQIPEGYSLCSYARHGFFELTAIMAINLGLYLVVRIYSVRNGEGYTDGYVKYALTVLLMQSFMFAILSFTKIFMYFYEFGYTPKRMLSMWGALILGAGALLLIGTLFKKKDMSRIWIMFTSVSYIVICLLSGVLDFLF